MYTETSEETPWIQTPAGIAVTTTCAALAIGALCAVIAFAIWKYRKTGKGR
jgi:hypothetical protein